MRRICVPLLGIVYWSVAAYLIVMSFYGAWASLERAVELQEAGNQDAAQATAIIGILVVLIPAGAIGVSRYKLKRISKPGLMVSLLISFAVLIGAAAIFNI